MRPSVSSAGGDADAGPGSLDDRGGSIKVERKDCKAAPGTGIHPMRGGPLPPELEAKIDDWIER